MPEQQKEQNRKSNYEERVQHEGGLDVPVKELVKRASTSATGTSDTGDEAERTSGKETVLTRLKREQVDSSGD